MSCARVATMKSRKTDWSHVQRATVLGENTSTGLSSLNYLHEMNWKILASQEIKRHKSWFNIYSAIKRSQLTHSFSLVFNSAEAHNAWLSGTSTLGATKVLGCPENVRGGECSSGGPGPCHLPAFSLPDVHPHKGNLGRKAFRSDAWFEC